MSAKSVVLIVRVIRTVRRILNIALADHSIRDTIAPLALSMDLALPLPASLGIKKPEEF